MNPVNQPSFCLPPSQGENASWTKRLPGKKPTVAIIFTGGTISMTVDESIGAAIPALSGHQIMSMITNIDQLANIEIIEFGDYPGPHITIDLLMKLRSLIQELCGKSHIQGVIVTHGTDSLEETAYFLDLTLQEQKPVVIVGAMRNSAELGYDGPANLSAAVCTAISPNASGKGVLVVMNNEVNTAAEVTKTNTLSLNTFQSPYGPIGVVDTNEFIVHRNITKREYIPVREVERRVYLIKSCLDMDDALIRTCIAADVKGLVIEAMGRGNLPPGVLPAIEEALHKGIAVVIVSRCHSGMVRPSYGYQGGGQKLLSMGIILGGELPGQKARIKLMLALGKTKDLAEIRKIFGN